MHLGWVQLLSWRLFLTKYTVMMLIQLAVWSACYYLWVHLLVFPYPMPFICVAGYLVSMPITFLILIFSFPQSWTGVQSFRTRRKYFFFVILYTQLIFLTYFGLEIAFIRIDPSYQWILAITLPIIREGHTYVFGLITSKSAGKQVCVFYKDRATMIFFKPSLS